MRKFATSLAVTALAIAGCGGGSSHHSSNSQHKYTVTLPSGQKVQSAHSPTFGLPPKGLTLPRPALGVPNKLMLDTVNLSSFSGLNPAIVAGYTSGWWPTFGQMVGKYPHVVAVMVYQTHFGVKGHRSCLDREPGDAPASAVGAWARYELLTLHTAPCVYASLSAMDEVRANLASALGFNWRTKVFLWDANWTYQPHLDAGYDATQWTDHYLNRNIDASQVTYQFAGIHTNTRVVCFGPHARPNSTACKKVISQVAGYRSALDASNRAYKARACPALVQRAAWFSNAIKSHPGSPRTAYRRRALATTRRVYKRNACAVYVGRAGYYSQLITQTQKKYS